MAENQRTCAIAGCKRSLVAKTFCKLHYSRFQKWGDPHYIKPRRLRDDAAARAQCAVDGCETLVGAGGARGYCPTHYSRWKRAGDPGPAERLYSPVPTQCSVAGCGSAPCARGLCNAHYLRYKLYGDAEYRHANRCVFCGLATFDVHPRVHCSDACRAMTARYDGARPAEGKCTRCGGAIDLMAKTKNGQYKRVDAKMCPECKRGRSTRHGYSVKAMVAIHGKTDCGICGHIIDLNLKSPHRLSPSIDHIIPYAHGGSNDPENLQLAHLHCNHVKSDRVTT